MPNPTIPPSIVHRSRLIGEVRKLRFKAGTRRQSHRAVPPCRSTAGDLYDRCKEATRAERDTWDALDKVEEAAVNAYPAWPDELYITVRAGSGKGVTKRTPMTREYLDGLRARGPVPPRVKEMLELYDRHMAAIDAAQTVHGVPEAEAATEAALQAVTASDLALIGHKSADIADIAIKLRRLVEQMEECDALEPDADGIGKRLYSRMLLACLADAERLARRGGRQ